MNLPGPLSKSTEADIEKCPWRIHALKTLGFKKAESVSGNQGSLLHKKRGDILCGKTTLEQALTEIDDTFAQRILRDSIINENIPWNDSQVMEEYIELRLSDGQCFFKPAGEGDFCGYIDRHGRDDWNNLFLEDYKSGVNEGLNRFEMESNSLLVHRAYGRPEEPITFYYYFGRSGNVVQHTYTPEDLKVIETDIKMRIAEIKALDPIPTPGDHCSNWYGQPCQFLGNECPLSCDLPAITGDVLNRPQYGQAFMMALMGEPMDKTVARDAFIALQQLRGGVDKVASRLQEFTKTNGPIRLGQDLFGVFPKYENIVDKVAILKAFYDENLTFEDIARAINISMTSLKKLTGKEFQDLRVKLLKEHVTTVQTGERFGKL